MSLVHALRHRLRVLLNPRAHERELAEEMEFHLGLEAMQQEHAAHGALSVEEAHLTARRQFGNVTYYREETRRVTGIAWLDGLGQDVRFALRSFRRAPTFTAVAVIMLALGLGANTAIFSVVDALLLRPLPFKEPDRLLLLSLTPSPGERTGWSYPKYALLRDARPGVFSDVSLVSRTEHTIRVGDEAVRDWGESIDAHYFPTLGVRVALGRNLLGQEGRPGGPRVVILSDALWRRAFDADPSALGQSMLVDGSPYTIVGVAPPRFAGFSGAAASGFRCTRCRKPGRRTTWGRTTTRSRRSAGSFRVRPWPRHERRSGGWARPSMPSIPARVRAISAGVLRQITSTTFG